MAKKCNSCGAELADDVMFCTECGTKLDAAVQPEPQAAPTPAPPPIPTPTPAPAASAPQPAADEKAQKKAQKSEQKAAKAAAELQDAPVAGSKFAPITTGGYIGIFLLLGIPIVGLLLAIIWACGGCKKISKRNLSRAYLIMLAVILVLSLVFGLAARFLLPGILEKYLPSYNGSAQSGYEENAANGSEGGVLSDLGVLGELLGGLSQMSGSGGLYGYDGNNEDLSDLEALQGLFEGLEGVTGAESGWDELIEGVTDINEQAEAANDGWPSSLRPYPDGTPNAVASYRTEFTGTSLETMLGWIEQLKADGFAYRDFYDFGMSEQDMLAMNGWWATDGEIYLSLSYYEGTVTVDHTYELPDLSSIFG